MANDYQWNPNEFSTQKKQIRAHLLSGRHITQLEALELYQCLRLSAIVFDLRNEGLPIIMEKIKVPSGKRVGDYFVNEEDLKQLNNK